MQTASPTSTALPSTSAAGHPTGTDPHTGLPYGSGPTSSGHYIRDEAIIGLGKRALDTVRAAVKIPEAARAGRLGAALAQTALGAPTSELIDSQAPAIATAASGGHSFTSFDKVAYRVAAGIDVGLGVFRVAHGIPNLVGAVKQNGAAGIYNSRQGRDGALQTASGALTLAIFGGAGAAAKLAGVKGTVPLLLAAATSETIAAPWVIVSQVGASGLVLANDHGFMDFLNKGNTESFTQSERTAWDDLDVRGRVVSAGTKAQSTDKPSFLRKIGALAVGYAQNNAD